MPAAVASDDNKIDMEALKTADNAMGRDLDDIFELIDGPAKEQFKYEGVVIDHQWNN